MKKHLLHLFLLLVALSVSPTINADVTFTVDGIQYSYIIHNDAVEVGRNEGFVGDAVINYMVKYRYKSYDVTAVGLNAFENCKGLTSIVLPKSVLEIRNKAFKNCDGLTSVEIPNTVTYIARDAFCDCNSLLEINVAEGNENYTTYDGVLYNKDMTALIQCPAGKTGTFVVPESVKVISDYAFSGCTGLTSITFPESLTEIGNSVFYGCTGLTSVTLPESLTTIGVGAFEGCTGLTSVTLPESLTTIGDYAFQGCSGLTSVTLPDSLTEIGFSAFSGCTGLTSVTLPDSLTEIGGSAFSGCTGLTSVTLPDSLTEIGSYAFEGCTSLTSVTLPESLITIGESAFEGCGISKIVIPSSVELIKNRGLYGIKEIHFDDSDKNIQLGAELSDFEVLRSVYIGRYATSYPYNKNYPDFRWPESLENVSFGPYIKVIKNMSFAGCKNLKKVIIPKSVTSVEGSIFYNAKCDSLIVKAELDQVSLKNLSGLSGNIITNGHNVYWDSAEHMFKLRNDLSSSKEWFSLKRYDLSFEILNFKRFLKGFSFKTVSNSYWDESETSETVLSAGEEWTLPAPDADGVYFAKGLDFDKSYGLVLKYKDSDTNQHEETIYFSTLRPYVNIERSSTQSTVTISSMSAAEDITCKPDGKMGVKYTHWDSGTETDVTDEVEYKGKNLTLTNFAPDYNVTLYPYAYYDGKRYDLDSQTVKTQPLNPTVRVVKKGPTSVELEGSYIKGDADISFMGFDYDHEGTSCIMTGLSPATRYYSSFFIESCGRKYNSKSIDYVTDPVSFTTLDPKCVSSTCAIVAAETNISEMETNAGFQWKKYDAPESLKPSEGYAAIYDGMLEGYIKNLQSTSYYNVRPFYKDANDKYYYGEWVTFDPSDFSYFEPTVHTYPVEEVDGTTATMRGYVLGGTDEITGQGFEYWELGGRESERRNAPSAGIMSVEGFGQVMRVVVDGLKEGTRYGFRTYVQTIAGKTYGEEQTFTTAGTVGVDEFTDEAAPEPVGYFDLCGRRYDVPQQGLNIVVYSDGSSRKFIRK